MDREKELIQILDGLGDICDPSFRIWLLNDGFLTAPASTKYHGNYPGGLFDHSYAVMNTLVDLAEKNDLKWQRKESPIIIGLFHDVCKADQYKMVKGTSRVPVSDSVSDNGVHCVTFGPDYHYEYNDNLLLKGHGDKSVMILSRFMRLTEEEVLCIRYHMGAYQTEDWAGYDLAIRKYPNLLYVNLADMYVSKVIGT